MQVSLQTVREEFQVLAPPMAGAPALGNQGHVLPEKRFGSQPAPASRKPPALAPRAQSWTPAISGHVYSAVDRSAREFKDQSLFVPPDPL